MRLPKYSQNDGNLCPLNIAKVWHAVQFTSIYATFSMKRKILIHFAADGGAICCYTIASALSIEEKSTEVWQNTNGKIYAQIFDICQRILGNALFLPPCPIHRHLLHALLSCTCTDSLLCLQLDPVGLNWEKHHSVHRLHPPPPRDLAPLQSLHSEAAQPPCKFPSRDFLGPVLIFLLGMTENAFF